LADRGLDTKRLLEAIVELKWHPFLRFNNHGRFRSKGWFYWQPFSCLLTAKSRRWQGQVTALEARKNLPS
jgi:hypothetical protein